MTTSSLRELAITKLPLATILGENLLGPSFESIRPALEERITLEQLVEEGLLNHDLSLDAFFVALEKISALWFWFYLDPTITTSEELPTFSPFSQDGFNRLNYSQEEFQAKVKAALVELQGDLVELLSLEGNYLEVTGETGMIWDYFHGKYRLFLHREGSIRSEEEEPGLHAIVETSFATFLRRLFYVFPGPLRFTPRDPNVLSKLERASLQVIANQFEEELLNLNDSVWTQGLAIETHGQFDLSLAFVTASTRIQAIGDYLYFFTSNEYPVYVDFQDGNLILVTLIYNYPRWSFTNPLI